LRRAKFSLLLMPQFGIVVFGRHICEENKINGRINLNTWLVISAVLLAMVSTVVGRTIRVDAYKTILSGDLNFMIQELSIYGWAIPCSTGGMRQQ